MDAVVTRQHTYIVRHLHVCDSAPPTPYFHAVWPSPVSLCVNAFLPLFAFLPLSGFFSVSLSLSSPLPLPPCLVSCLRPNGTHHSNCHGLCMQARMLEPHVPEELTSYIVEAYVALRAQSGQDAKNGDQVCGDGSWRGGEEGHTHSRPDGALENIFPLKW